MMFDFYRNFLLVGRKFNFWNFYIPKKYKKKILFVRTKRSFLIKWLKNDWIIKKYHSVSKKLFREKCFINFIRFKRDAKLPIYSTNKNCVEKKLSERFFINLEDCCKTNNFHLNSEADPFISHSNQEYTASFLKRPISFRQSYLAFIFLRLANQTNYPK